jgi:hypothetical protein
MLPGERDKPNSNRIPDGTNPNRISGFGEEALNARAEIGHAGVETGWVEHKACDECADEVVRRSTGGRLLRRRWSAARLDQRDRSLTSVFCSLQPFENDHLCRDDLRVVMRHAMDRGLLVLGAARAERVAHHVCALKIQENLEKPTAARLPERGVACFKRARGRPQITSAVPRITVAWLDRNPPLPWASASLASLT